MVFRITHVDKKLIISEDVAQALGLVKFRFIEVTVNQTRAPITK
jgi:hypothetical protein